jgi:hypothetical protein
MPSRRRRRPFPTVSDDHSAGSSIISSQHLHGCVKEYANVVLGQTEHDAFLVQGNTKTPKISNRYRLDAQIPRDRDVSHVFRHVAGRSSNESREVMRECGIYHQDRTVPSISVEASNSSKASESISAFMPSADKNSILQSIYQPLNRLDTNKQASRAPIDFQDNFIMEQPSKAKRVKLFSVDEEGAHQSTKRQTCTLRERNSCPAQHGQTASPETIDAMDCSSGESLDMDLSTQPITRKGYASPCNTLDHGSITPSMLGKLCKSKVDNPEVMAAMFASFPSPHFPLGCTIGGEESDDFQSLDGSEITMRTIEKLETESKKKRLLSHLMRSQTYPSNFVENQYFEADETIISVATRTARDKCLSILKGGRRSVAATTFLPNVDRITTKKSMLTIHATDKGLDAGQSNDDVSPPRKHSPHNEVTSKGAMDTKSTPAIIRLDRLPEPSTNHVLFECNGEIFQHAPLPSGWEVRISKSKNRPFYTHPDRGATWYCPVVNPIGPSESASLSIVPASVEETIGCNIGTREDETTNSFNRDSDNSSASDADDSRASTGSSGLSVRSMDETSIENTLYAKAGKGAKYSDCITSTSRTSPMGGISNTVKRSVTVEQDDLESHSSDTTPEKPVRGAVGYLANQSGASTTLSVSKNHGNDDMLDISTQNSPQEEIHLNFTSPDEEIVSLVLVNLACRQARAKGTTLALYPSDRIDSPSQLSAVADSSKFHDEGAIGCNQANPEVAMGSPCISCESSPIQNRVLSMFHSPDRLLPDQMVANQDDYDVVQANCDSQNVHADEFSTFDDHDVQSGDKRTFKRLEQGSEVHQQRSTTADADIQLITRQREVEFEISCHDNSFHAGNGASDTSADDQNELDGNVEDGGYDYPHVVKSPGLANESVAASDDDTDSWIEDKVVVASKACLVFHPNVVETNGVCSVSTLGEYKHSSCAGGTYLSKMSFRILNPPHPICALQKLDHMFLIAERSQRVHARQFGRLKANGKYSTDPRRRLDFLESL